MEDILRLSKKQERAISIAVEAMGTLLGNGQDSGEDGELDFAIDELLKMRDDSMEYKRKQYIKKNR